MRWWVGVFYALSAAAHVGLYAEVSAIPKDRPRRPTTVKVFETKKKEKKKEEEKKEDKPPPPPPKKVEAPSQPKNTPPPPTNTTPTPVGHEAMAALPDFGIALSGGGEGGIAVPVAGITANAGSQRAAGSNAATEKKVRGPAPKPTDAADACVEEATKPKYRDRVQPQYPDSARSANIEGKVRIEVTINAEGDVTDARIVQGLGHGLDEAALVAMKRTKFHPATKCGKPVATTIVIPITFGLSD